MLAHDLPDNLKPFITEQDYSKYTSRDQAVWRYIMRQNRKFFATHAHPVYLSGLEKTGISLSQIPHVETISRQLSEFGWGAVCVQGFIPPAAFLEFQARNLLPIATDMRTLAHLDYTPAPDIVHEAAGHAPIIADRAYAEYLTKYALLARKAIYSREDINTFEAIRSLSDIKENPDTSANDIIDAENKLQEALGDVSFTSESAKVTRMYWWTAEYGLIRMDGQLKIYGAGLLSSVGEGYSCLQDAVKKIPISISCVDQDFNITEPQPQLFVTDSFDDLYKILDELAATMAFTRGGRYGLDKARESRSLTTTVLDSGISISGVLEEYRDQATQSDSLRPESPAFIRWSGPVQLAQNNAELENHGRSRHSEGFSTPIGLWKDLSKNPSLLTDAELSKYGINQGSFATLKFESGFTVKGIIAGITRDDSNLLLITWKNCTATFDGHICFAPDWGAFDMAVGTSISSVYGGSADFQKYGSNDLGEITTQPGRTSPFSADELDLFEIYKAIREVREEFVHPAGDPTSSSASEHNPTKNSLPQVKRATQKKLSQPQTATLHDAATRMTRDHPHEWLAAIEVLELLSLGGVIKPEAFREFAHTPKSLDFSLYPIINDTRESHESWSELVHTIVSSLTSGEHGKVQKTLIENGLRLLATAD